MQAGLTGQIIVFVMGALLVMMIAFLISNARRKARNETAAQDLRYEFYSEPRDEISPDFAEMFGDFLPAPEPGLQMVRLSFTNRGRLPVTRTDFSRPIVIVFPSFAKVLSARYSEFRGRGVEPEQQRQPYPHGNAVEIYPMEVPPDGTVVFDIAVLNSGEPEGVYGHFAGQDRIPRLGEKPPAPEPAPRRR